MDIGKAFGFVFQDERWVSKVAIGGLIALVPILNFAVYGYMIQVARNVAQDNPRPLPEWNDLGDHFMRGLYVIVIGIVYLIPYFVAACILQAASIGASSAGEEAAVVGGAFACILIPIMLVLALGGALLSYAGMARFVATNNLSDALKFGEVFSTIRNNASTWLMLLLVIILAGLFAGLGVIGCGIGVLFTAFIASCINGHALGQVVRQLGLMGRDNPYATQPIPPSYGPPPTYQ